MPDSFYDSPPHHSQNFSDYPPLSPLMEYHDEDISTSEDQQSAMFTPLTNDDDDDDASSCSDFSAFSAMGSAIGSTHGGEMTSRMTGTNSSANSNGGNSGSNDDVSRDPFSLLEPLMEESSQDDEDSSVLYNNFQDHQEGQNHHDHFIEEQQLHQPQQIEHQHDDGNRSISPAVVDDSNILIDLDAASAISTNTNSRSIGERSIGSSGKPARREQFMVSSRRPSILEGAIRDGGDPFLEKAKKSRQRRESPGIDRSTHERDIHEGYSDGNITDEAITKNGSIRKQRSSGESFSKRPSGESTVMMRPTSGESTVGRNSSRDPGSDRRKSGDSTGSLTSGDQSRRRRSGDGGRHKSGDVDHQDHDAIQYEAVHDQQQMQRFDKRIERRSHVRRDSLTDSGTGLSSEVAGSQITEKTNSTQDTQVTSNVTQKIASARGIFGQKSKSASTVHSTRTAITSNKATDGLGNGVLRHVDDECDETDYELNIFFQLCEMTLQPETPTSTADTRWANIRRWMSDHRSREERYAACVQQGIFSATPLHLVCQSPECPLDVVRAMIEHAPETASWEDTNGWLPLHYGCAKGASIEALEVLLQAYPGGMVAQDKRMRTPLHFAFYKSGNEEQDKSKSSGNRSDKTVADIVSLLRNATKVPDEKGRLPLHFAAAYGASAPALEALLDLFPRSIETKENMGRTPLHYVMANAHNDASPNILKFFTENHEESLVDDIDDEGNLPIHLMSTRVETMKEDADKDRHARENVIACLSRYLDAEPKTSADFLTALQSLPAWLRDEAVTHPHIQQALAQKISRQFPTSILFLDCYLYILNIWCFSFASNAHIDYRFGAEDLPNNLGTAITLCYLGVTYFLIRGFVTLLSMISLNTFRSWFTNYENWINILMISLVYHYCGAMQSRENEIADLANYATDDDLSFRTGVAFTLGVLWLSVTTFLKSTMLEFSVFFESVLYVTKKLFIFMVSLLVILVNFSLMFLIVFRRTPVCSQECMSDFGVFPHCDFNKSLLKVYTMMLGEIGEVNRYQQNLTAQLLYVAFVFLVVILLSNILIAIVTDSHNIIQNERAEIVFWSNRLDFVAEMVAIVAMRNKVFTYMPCCGGASYSRQAQQEADDNLSQGRGSGRNRKSSSQQQESLVVIWTTLFSFLKEETSDDTSLVEFVLFTFLRILVIIIVFPLWLAIGLVTAGSLWPPQIREWLFASKTSGKKNDTITLMNHFDERVANMKEGVTGMKSSILGEVEKAKNHYDGIQVKIEKIQKDVKMDIAEVKHRTKRMIGILKKQRSRRSERRRRKNGSGGDDGGGGSDRTAVINRSGHSSGRPRRSSREKDEGSSSLRSSKHGPDRRRRTNRLVSSDS